MARTNPGEFVQQVRREVAKVTWPSRRETMVTTMMGFIFGAIASVFFLIVDWFLSNGVKLILGLGG
jgi:preprotein translocase subunit SecE